MKYLTIALVLALAGCSTHVQWTKVGAGPADVEKAKLECEFEAAKHDVGVFQVTWQTELKQIQLIQMCMRAKGFSS